MKTKLIFLVLLIACFSCTTNNPVSDAQKEKIKGEVKEVVNTFIKGCEEANSDMLLGIYLDSPDFVYAYNGNSFGYKQIESVMKTGFSTLLNQKLTLVDEKYAVLNNSTVLYTTNCKCLMNFKDGHSILQDPWIVQLLIKKIDKKWKVISGNESGAEQSVKNTETSKELNQVELFKKIIGDWKAELTKDTAYYWSAKAFGTGLECYLKIVAKDKIISEVKQIWGYDSKLDKYVGESLVKGKDIEIWAWWFTSNNKSIDTHLADISNPDKASSKGEGEYKSPDAFSETDFVNGKPVMTYNFKRIK